MATHRAARGALIDDIEMRRLDAEMTWNRPLDDDDGMEHRADHRVHGAGTGANNVDDDENDSGSNNNDMDDPVADVVRCSVDQRTCLPRTSRRWALAWAVLAALAVVAIVAGPWYGERLGPRWSLATGAERCVCVPHNHTVIESRFDHAGNILQVPGVGVRMASTRGGADVVVVARPRLLWDQSWMSALLVPAYWNLYPIGVAVACYQSAGSSIVAMRDGVDALGSETLLCASIAVGAATLAFACVYRLLVLCAVPVYA